MSNEDPEKVALTPTEFAALFGKSQSWAYRQLYSGKVKALTGYGRTLIPISEVERLLEAAGRYMGSDVPAKQVQTSSTTTETEVGSSGTRCWKEAISDRRSKNKPQTTGGNAAKNAVIRKLNRHRNRS